MTRIRMAAHANGLRAVLVAAAMLLPLGLRAAMAEEARVIPAPALDEPATQNGTRTIVLAGGCFWGVQGVFQHTRGVISAVSGYAGGDKSTAQYEKVTTGATGHAESVQITYDPRQITYGRLLRIFFAVVHDPTQLNRQGPDIGTQYRSAIFPADAEQARIAKAYVAQLNQARAFPAAIVTRIEADRPFYPAELRRPIIRTSWRGIPRTPTSSTTTPPSSRTCSASSPLSTAPALCSCQRRVHRIEASS